MWGIFLLSLSSVPRYQHVLISLKNDLACVHFNYFVLFCLALQRYNYAERVATCIDDYVQSSRRGGGRGGGKSGGGKSLADGGASADTGVGGEAFSTGETVGWGCPRVRCVSSCSCFLAALLGDVLLGCGDWICVALFAENEMVED